MAKQSINQLLRLYIPALIIMSITNYYLINSVITQRALLSHFYHTFATLLSHFYHIFTTLLPYFYHTFTTLLPYFYHFYHTFTILLPHFYHTFTILLPHFYHTFTILLSHFYHTFTTLLPYFYHTFTTLLPYFCHTFTILWGSVLDYIQSQPGNFWFLVHLASQNHLFLICIFLCLALELHSQLTIELEWLKYLSQTSQAQAGLVDSSM